MLGTTYRPNTIYLIIALILFSIVALFIYADTIAITAPPWDYCGFTQTHIGDSFVCIGFDQDVSIIK